MNKPIQTESRKKHRGDRRQQSNGAQDEMQQILAGDQAPDLNNVTPEDGAILREQHAELEGGNSNGASIPVSLLPADPLSTMSAKVTIGPSDLAYKALTDMGSGASASISGVATLPYVGDGYVAPQVSTPVGAGHLPQIGTGVGPAILPLIGEPLEHLRAHPAKAGGFIDFTKMPMPQLKVLVKRMPTAFAGDQNLLKLLMTEMYLSVHGLQRGFSVTKNGSKYSHSQEVSEIGYTFWDAPKRERSKLFEAWGRLVDSNGVNAGTSFSAFYCAFDGTPTKNAEGIVDVWTAEIFPVGIAIEAVTHDTQAQPQPGTVGFGVQFGGTVARLLDGPDAEVAKLLAEQ
jgi:hypothetical protein